MLEELKTEVCRANCELVAQGLVTLTFGNVSGIDRDQELVAIKPSGISYEDLLPEHIVIVDMDGNVVEGDLNPSSDTATHVALYRAFETIGGITHTHSTHATAFAQACRPIPCFGTTHADHFYGDIPVTRAMTQEEVEGDYEANTGAVIVERYADLDAAQHPAVLVAHHGPFVWATNAMKSVENAVALEEVAHSALLTLSLAPPQPPIPQFLLDKHFLRKHGSGAYYGQK
jgi:L-ribulose-5-phosphate 4-epimerase